MLGNRIRELRKNANLTQKELADKLNISEQSVAHYESNRRSPDPTMLQKIANFFEVTVDYLIGNDLSEKLIKQEEENKQVVQAVIDGLSNPLNKVLYSKASELKSDKDRQIVLNVINSFIEEVDNKD